MCEDSSLPFIPLAPFKPMLGHEPHCVSIMKLQEASGAMCNLKKGDNKLKIVGNAAQMKIAQKEWGALKSEFGGDAVVVSVEGDEAVAVTGRKAGELRKAQEESGAWVDLIKDENCIRLRGKPANVGALLIYF